MTDVQITVPVADEPCEGYCPKEFMMLLDGDEFRALHRIRGALRERAATLENGSAVADSRDTIRWILQQIDAV